MALEKGVKKMMNEELSPKIALSFFEKLMYGF